MKLNLKLDFKLTTLNGQEVYLAEPYKVQHYDWSSGNGSSIEDKPHWSATHRIPAKHRVDGKWKTTMQFGDAVEKISMYRGKEYATKEEAMEACQKHYEAKE